VSRAWKRSTVEARLAGGQEIDRDVVLEEADVRMGSHTRQQHPLDLTARRIAVMEDAATGMAAFTPEIEAGAQRRRVGRGRVELHAQLEERVDHRWAPAHHPPHHVLVAEAGPRRERVLHVAVDGVVRPLDRRDPALRPVGRRVGGRLLGHDGDATPIGHAQGIEEARDSAADHQEVEAQAFSHVNPPRGA
jgi:hypothetical protein